MAFASDIVVIGMPGDDVQGVEGSGSVYLFQQSGSLWTQLPKLVSTPPGHPSVTWSSWTA